MQEYILKGRVLPVRATLSLGELQMQVLEGENKTPTEVAVSIYSNEVTVYYNTTVEIDIFDLRNICLNLVNGIISAVGYYSGIGWTLEITQVLNRKLSINYVYGADIPCLSKRNDIRKFSEFWQKISFAPPKERIFIDRCFSDLTSAIKHPLDTPFYCYRAIESLRHLCAIRYGLSKESEQWQKLSELSGKTWDDIKHIKDFANNARHGNHKSFTDNERESFFTVTWDLIDGFLDSLMDEENPNK
jgi:hypothetical protein